MEDISRVTLGPPWLLSPMTIPDLTGAALDSGSCLVSPVCPTTMLSLTAGSAPTTILLGGGGGGGRGSPEKKVAPSCLVMGFGLRWSLVLVKLLTTNPGVAPRLPSVRCSLEAGSPP